jgi:hypothetical protein
MTQEHLTECRQRLCALAMLGLFIYTKASDQILDCLFEFITV